MKTIAVGTTVSPQARAAAAELVDQARSGLGGIASLALLWATPALDLPVLVQSVRRFLGPVPLWGGTSAAGVFGGGSWLGGETAACLLLVADRPAGVGFCLVESNPLEAGRLAAQAAVQQSAEQPSALLTCSCLGSEEGVLSGAGYAVPRVPVVGGTAGYTTGHPASHEFANGLAFEGAAVVASLSGPVGYAFGHGYAAASPSGVITRAEGRRVCEVDGLPAVEVYARWCGTSASTPALTGDGILAHSVFHPLLLERGGDTLAVHLVSVRPDGSIETGMAMAAGQRVRLGGGSADSLVETVTEVVGRAAAGVRRPAGLVLAHCAGRALGLGPRLAEVPARVRSVVGDLPWIGFLAFGEQGTLGSGLSVHANLSLSALVLGE